MHRFKVNQHSKTIKMEKTAIQHAIESIQNSIFYTPDLVEINGGRENAIGVLKALRQWERNQIEQAYKDGLTGMFSSDASDYFTSKYGNNE